MVGIHLALHQVIFSLGTNCEPRDDYLKDALRALEIDPVIELESVMISQTYESPPLLPPNAPAEWNMKYLNLVMCGFTSATPEKLLKRVKSIEQRLGRRNRGWWGPREIDIDILALDDITLDDPQLKLPHSEMLKRDFVMIPLAEILPNWRHPKDCRRTASDYAATYKSRTQLVPYFLRLAA